MSTPTIIYLLLLAAFMVEASLFTRFYVKKISETPEGEVQLATGIEPSMLFGFSIVVMALLVLGLYLYNIWPFIITGFIDICFGLFLFKAYHSSSE